MSLDIALTIAVNTGGTKAHRVVLYDANITHNLNRMAEEAGLYGCLWRPEENGITKAGQLIEPLTRGLEMMRADRARFEAYNASNGWGLYEDFVPWLEQLLAACKAHPMATVEASR